MEKNDKIKKLMQDFVLINPELGKIIQSLRQITLSIALGSEEKIMYGGIIFKIPDRMFCGIFLRKNHVSVEFDLGYLLKDPEKFLEGSGKNRRHLKIHNESELKEKQVENIIHQSFTIKPPGNLC